MDPGQRNRGQDDAARTQTDEGIRSQRIAWTKSTNDTVRTNQVIMTPSAARAVQAYARVASTMYIGSLVPGPLGEMSKALGSASFGSK